MRRDERPAQTVALKTSEVVARAIRGRIARRELLPGDRLPPEDELMSSLGVARTTVREALRVLESQGLIKVLRGRQGGGRVTRPPVEVMAQMLAVDLQMQGVTYGDLEHASQFLEPALAGRLARVRTNDDLAALEAIVDRADAAANAGDRSAFARAATDLHEEIVARAGNKTLATLSRLLHELRAEYYSWASARSADERQLQKAARSYRRLLLLIEARDSAGTEDHWRRQLAYMLAETPDHDTIVPFV